MWGGKVNFLETVQCKLGLELGTGFRKEKFRFGHHGVRKGTTERRQN